MSKQCKDCVHYDVCENLSVKKFNRTKNANEEVRP